MAVSRFALALVASCFVAAGCGRGIVDDPPKVREKNNVGPAGDDVPADDETKPDPITTCKTLPKAAPAGQSCAFDPGSAVLAIHANIITPDALLKGGQLVIAAAGNILCAACDCSAEAAGASLLSCPDAVVAPGLINAHDHLKWSNMAPKGHGDTRYDHRTDWRKGVRGHQLISTAGSADAKESHSLGELRFVMTGATSSISSTTGPAFMRNLDDKAMEGLIKEPVQYETFPLGDSSKPKLITGGCGYDGFVGPRVGYSAYFPHVAEGIDEEAHNEFLCMSSTDNGGRDFMTATTAIIHGIGLDLQDGMRMAASGSTLVWSPRTNIDLYGFTASVTMMHRVGVNIALGTDWLLSGSMNVSREFACADQLNKTQYGGFFNNKELVDMATANAARAAHMDDVIGTLEAGKVADVAMYAHADKGYRAVIVAEAKDTLLVLRGGVPLYGEAKILEDLGMTDDTCETLEVCGVHKRVCVQREVGTSLETLKTAAAHNYPLFTCGVPQDEPSCVPFRKEADDSIRFTGEAQTDDLDGDGVKDAADKCPTVFDPPRPMDGTAGSLAQDDFDEDGVGDACDVCPIDPNSDTCKGASLGDRDDDGIKDNVDNCASVKNADQKDSDGDKKGDACDACPSQANPGTQGCTLNIYAIKQQAGLQGQAVRLTDVLVTAKGVAGFYVAHVPGDAQFISANDSGLYVFGAQMVNVGDRVSFDAIVDKYHEQLQLKTVQNFSTSGSGNAVPMPPSVTTAEVGPGGSKVALEGTLVKLMAPLTVTAVSGSRMVVTGSDGKALSIGTQLYTLGTVPGIGTKYLSATGVLRKYDDTMEISIRAAADLVNDGPPVPGALVVIGEVMPNPMGADTGLEWVKLYNPGTLDADLSQYEIKWGGDKAYGTGKVTLTGTLTAGKCILVHEGTSNTNNGSPQTAMPPTRFVPALQKTFGGLPTPASADADAIGVFKTVQPAVPVDLVTYRLATSGPLPSGFIGTDGQLANVMVYSPNVAENRSFIRTGMAAWTISAAGASTPNVCPTFVP